MKNICIHRMRTLLYPLIDTFGLLPFAVCCLIDSFGLIFHAMELLRFSFHGRLLERRRLVLLRLDDDDVDLLHRRKTNIGLVVIKGANNLSIVSYTVKTLYVNKWLNRYLLVYRLK